MMKHNIIEECFRPRAINTVFLKPKEDKTFRIVFDARTWNQPFVAPKIELPNPHKALQKDKYYVKFDITNGYWHFPLHRNARPFYAFKVEGKTYQWKVLPFGDTRAPYEFTRIFKYILNKIRRKYKIKSKSIVYMHDILMMNSSKFRLRNDVNKLLKGINEWGLKINDDKSTLRRKVFEFLGYEFNSKEISIKKTKKRIIYKVENRERNVYKNTDRSELEKANWVNDVYGETVPRNKEYH